MGNRKIHRSRNDDGLNPDHKESKSIVVKMMSAQYLSNPSNKSLTQSAEFNPSDRNFKKHGIMRDTLMHAHQWFESLKI